MKKKVLFALAAGIAVIAAGCCCCSQPGCVQEEEVIIATPAKASKKCSCNGCGDCKKDDKTDSKNSNTVAVNIAGCSSESGTCPTPAPAPAPANE